MSQQMCAVSIQEKSVRGLTTSLIKKEIVSPEQNYRQNSCKVQYRPRWFLSKGAFLVLVWVVLSAAAARIPANLQVAFLNKIIAEGGQSYEYLFYIQLLPFITSVITPLLSGWLADTLLGSYKTIKAGAVLLFFSVILFCVLAILTPEILLQNVDILQNDDTNTMVTLTAILLAISSSMCYAGVSVATVNALQLGLEQMPYASTDNITSFIAWFVLCLFTGFWLGKASETLVPCAAQWFNYLPLWSLFAVLCASIILCLDFLLPPKWLTKQSKSQQSIKGIYNVLKYAKQHKHPVQRSSLTYWEEELPSRIDLGKSKYGGPFTFEQVENVKTVLRMLVVTIPMWLIFASNFMTERYHTTLSTDITNTTNCTTAIVTLFTKKQKSWSIVTILIYEFAIYPFIRKSPTILKRFGAAAFILVLVCSSYLILSIIQLHYGNTIEDLMQWSGIVLTVISGILKTFLMTTALEFVCAQSPFDMRNLLIGYIWCIDYIPFITHNILHHLFEIHCKGQFCTVIYYTIATVFGVSGFVLHCILAHWYKRRKRDDDKTPQQWAEEAYDRYLQADVRCR